MTLTDFLLARIAEDEAAAGRGRRHNAPETYANDNYGCLLVDPARVLVVCEAHRRIVETHRPDGGSCSICAAWDDMEPYDPPPSVDWPCPTLRALAPIYAEHEDWREEWAL